MKTNALLFLVSLLVLISVRALSQTEMLENRQIITPTAYPVTVMNIGDPVNSGYDDFAPMILGNGRVMYFTTSRDGDHNIYSSVPVAGGWDTPLETGPTLNTSENDGGASITPDGHWMIFVGCEREDGIGDCDLYLAEYTGGSWRGVRNLGRFVNSIKWDSQPAISVDGLTLYFASERDGGYGGTDIWKTTRSYGGEWSPPVNLGSMINTAADEVTPYIAADNKTLYFSSNGHPGVGGFDVYVTRRSGSNYSQPENAGTPINSAFDDIFYSLQLGSDNVYMATDRPGGSGDLDIWLGVPNPLPPSAVTTVTGTVTDQETSGPVGAILTVRDISTNEIISAFHSDDVDGNYVVVLQPGKSYVITSEAPGYLFFSDRFDVPRESPNNTVRKDISMTRDLVRLLVYFDFDKANLQKESSVDLDRAAEWLKQNPNVKVELAGHTDNVGSRDYNKRLSQDRSAEVRNYFLRKGIDSRRLKAVGYGMDEPIATNETEEGRAINRRVEFRVRSR